MDKNKIIKMVEKLFNADSFITKNIDIYFKILLNMELGIIRMTKTYIVF